MIALLLLCILAIGWTTVPFHAISRPSASTLWATSSKARESSPEERRASRVDEMRRNCSRVMQRQRDVLSDIFSSALDGVRDAVIVGVPYHENK